MKLIKIMKDQKKTRNVCLDLLLLLFWFMVIIYSSDFGDGSGDVFVVETKNIHMGTDFWFSYVFVFLID
jgi:hypothetical protein